MAMALYSPSGQVGLPLFSLILQFKMFAVDDVFTEEDFYLCKMFGEDCRFVEFYNQTGRVVRLESRLEIERFPNMAWSTNINIPPSQSHIWRFLGNSQHQSDQISYLTILPEPWSLSRENSFCWRASLADTTEEDQVTFDQKSEVLTLQSLPELNANERIRVNLRRKCSLITSLRKLAADKVISCLPLDEDKIEDMQIPRSLKMELSTLNKSHQEMTKKKVEKCPRCSEIHQQL